MDNSKAELNSGVQQKTTKSLRKSFIEILEVILCLCRNSLIKKY